MSHQVALNNIVFRFGDVTILHNNNKKNVSLFPGVHYYLNIHRCAYGGVIPVRSLLDGTPQVRGAEVFAVNSDCKQVFYEEGGTWKPYISARDIKCTRTKGN